MNHYLQKIIFFFFVKIRMQTIFKTMQFNYRNIYHLFQIPPHPVKSSVMKLPKLSSVIPISSLISTFFTQQKKFTNIFSHFRLFAQIHLAQIVRFNMCQKFERRAKIFKTRISTPNVELSDTDATHSVSARRETPRRTLPTKTDGKRLLCNLT